MAETIAERCRHVIAASRNLPGRLAQLRGFLLAAMRKDEAIAILRGVALRCLIVDDNGSFLDAARDLLEREGIDVVGVSSTTSEALAEAQSLRPDVVLVDVMLGDESGVELARRLNEAGETVVMISTHAQADIEDLLSGTPAAGFVSKSELSASAIRRVLDGSEPNPPRGT
jgi:DNA-binding NarL/FixJ family response regulator